MVNESPLDRAGQALSNVVQLLRAVFGDEVATKAAALLEDPIRFTSAPATTKAELEDLLRQGTMNLDVTPENIRRLFHIGVAVEKLGEVLAPQPASSSMATSERQTLEFLQTSLHAVGADRYRAAMNEIEAIEPSTLIDPALLSMPTTTALLFEPVAKQVGEVLRRAAEGFYRPMLASMLVLTFQRTGCSDPVKNELGALMFQCGDVWRARGGPTAALLDIIRVVRNSESHHNTEIDVRAETITFVNKPRAPRPVETLGPLDRPRLAALAREVLDHVVGMRRAFAAITVE